MTGGSLTTNEGRDPLLPVRRMPDLVEMVLAGMDPRDPRISPLYARFERPPPVLLQVGSVEILLDDSQRMAEVLRKAVGAVRVSVWPGCPHGWQLLDGYLPEARQALDEVRDFVAGLQVTALSQPPSGN
jgi:acetyl esterase/lipase